VHSGPETCNCWRGVGDLYPFGLGSFRTDLMGSTAFPIRVQLLTHMMGATKGAAASLHWLHIVRIHHLTLVHTSADEKVHMLLNGNMYGFPYLAVRAASSRTSSAH